MLVAVFSIEVDRSLMHLCKCVQGRNLDFLQILEKEGAEDMI